MKRSVYSFCLLICLALDLYANHAQEPASQARNRRAQELLDKGKQLLTSKRYDEAIAALKEAVSLEPDMARAHYYLGQAAGANRQIEEAIAHFERAIAIHEREAQLDGWVVFSYTNKWRLMLKRADFEQEASKIRAEIERLAANRENREIFLRAVVEGYKVIADDEARHKHEELFLSEFPKSGFAVEIAARRIQEEADPAVKAKLIEDYLPRFPEHLLQYYRPLLFRYYASQTDSPAEKLLDAGEAWIKGATKSAYEQIETRSSVATALAERRIALARAQAIADEAVRLAGSLSADRSFMSNSAEQERQRLIAFLKERAASTRGFVLLRSGKIDEAAAELEVALRPVIDEVEKRGYILWRDAFLREIGVRPRVFWLAELYEGLKDYDRAAKYLLAGYTDDARLNEIIKHRLLALYGEMKRGSQAAEAELKRADERLRDLSAAAARLAGEERAKILAKRINTPAPDFKVTAIDKRQIELKDLRGKVVALNFWATWCGPCVAEMPHFQKAFDKYAGNPDVVFLAVSVDENRLAARRFIEKNRYKFPVAYGVEAAARFGVVGIPAMFIIDRAGAIQYRIDGFGGSGADYIERLAWRIDELLKQSTPASGQEPSKE